MSLSLSSGKSPLWLDPSNLHTTVGTIMVGLLAAREDQRYPAQRPEYDKAKAHKSGRRTGGLCLRRRRDLLPCTARTARQRDGLARFDEDVIFPAHLLEGDGRRTGSDIGIARDVASVHLVVVVCFSMFGLVVRRRRRIVLRGDSVAAGLGLRVSVRIDG